jgi:hypothetical protein
MVTEPPKGATELSTRIERNAIPFFEALCGDARRLTRDVADAQASSTGTIGECRTQKAKVNR